MALYINGNKIGGGGGNSNMQELTQEEYDELTTEEKNNGTVYYITDVNGDGSQFQPVIYSTDEREIGVWTDGKPLYEKVFIASSPISVSGSGWIATSFTISSENIVSATLIDPNGNTSGELPVANIDGYININPLFSANVKTIILQYTKTTDQAGSGTWTPQGVPAVHYSTDEQIVGTWIDGSTLYQKVIEYTTPFNISHDSWYTSTESYSDVNLIVNAWCINSNGAIYNGIIVVIENNKLVIGNQTYNQPINNLKYVIIQYTKTL